MTTNAQRLALLGIRLPLRGDLHNGRLIVDADGHAIAMVMPNVSATLERDRAATIIATLNRLLAEDAQAAHEVAERRVA